MFYNTINLTGIELQKAKEQTLKQEDLILSIFKKNPYKKISPSQIFSLTNDFKLNWPLTSIRRAITNLTKDEALIKLKEDMADGLYGKPEHFWRLNLKVEQQKLF